ncbi:MAG: histidine--tRNA ligase [Thermoguttaceae bacterium]|nr:histidine--tRNA ligase [Thermoguttaceae bacterium]MDW8077683.1 histidine--tRNA ligase [Thermoguttaceae bacterium]
MTEGRTRIEPRVLKGFRDYLPPAMMVRERIMETARQVYRSYGFSPIDTPALEYLEILAGKGGEETDRQLYKFQDHGGRWVALRFDLTVPFARFAAEHIHKLGTPLKRYQIGTVWRGENPQRGRYREFVQCDFDTIGTKSLSADIETALVIHDLVAAIGFEAFTVRLNSREVLSGILETLGLEEKAIPLLRALDKLPKVGPEQVLHEMESAGVPGVQARELLDRITTAASREDNHAVLRALDQSVAGSTTGQAGVAKLREILAGLEAAGIPRERVRLDPTIARGLDYYTGTVYETFLAAAVEIGSICSGGRYDNLAALYTDQELPGVGASLGLDRLVAAMEKLGMVSEQVTPAAVFLAYFDPGHYHQYLQIARKLRQAGLTVDLYPEPKKIGQQLKYADRRGFPVAVIVGSDEFAAGVAKIKDLAKGQEEVIPLDPECRQLAEAIGRILARR